MRRVALGLAVFTIAVVGCSSGSSQVSNEPVQIEIHVGEKSLDYPNKARMPIPEVPVGSAFEVKVLWSNPSDEPSLMLSDFYTVSYYFDDSTGRTEPLWQSNGDTLQVFNERDEKLDGILLRPNGDEKYSKGTFVLKRDPDARGPENGRPSLIFFKVEMTNRQGAVFTYDPPWVEIPPTG